MLNESQMNKLERDAYKAQSEDIARQFRESETKLSKIRDLINLHINEKINQEKCLNEIFKIIFSQKGENNNNDTIHR